MEKKELLYEGKAKKVYKTEDPEQLIVSYKDDATAFNGLKKGTIVGKGVINNKMSNRLMKLLEKEGIPTHLVSELSERDTLVKRVSIVPLEVIVRNISAGSFAKRYGVEEGIVFPSPTIEFSYKNDALGDPLLNRYHALALGLATEKELDTIASYSFTKSSLCIGRSLARAFSLCSTVLEIIISLTAAIRSSAKNICSVRHRPIPSAPNLRAVAASFGVSALALTLSLRTSLAQPIILPKYPAISASTVLICPAYTLPVLPSRDK